MIVDVYYCFEFWLYNVHNNSIFFICAIKIKCTQEKTGGEVKSRVNSIFTFAYVHIHLYPFKFVYSTLYNILKVSI